MSYTKYYTLETQDGNELLSCNVLENSNALNWLRAERWDGFEPVVQRAKDACQNAGGDVLHHFRDVTKMVKIGSDAERETQDIKLTRRDDVNNNIPSDGIIYSYDIDEFHSNTALRLINKTLVE